MRLVCYILFFLSGCASLIYEVVWTRQFMLLLGSTTYAITTVVVAFMSGLALGTYLAGRWSHWFRQPVRAYAGLEIAIGAYALLVPVLMATADPIYRALYPHAMGTPWLLTALRFMVSILVLIVPTTCMGATLPIMMTYMTREDRRLGLSAGYLYGINTIGATLGCALAGFWLMPAIGLTWTTRVAAGINFLIGLIGWFFLQDKSRPLALSPSVPRLEKMNTRTVPASPDAFGVVLVAAGVSGLAGMIYQIAWTRALIMSIGSSTYSFTCILAAFIMGLGLGSLAMARFVDRLRQPLLILGLLEFGIGLSAALIVPIHGQIPVMVHQLVAAHHQNYQRILTLEFLLVVGVTVVPTLLMGAAFPLMTRIVGLRYSKPGEAIGRVYVINTLGAIAGCMLAGFVLIRSEILGIRGSIVAAAVANAIVGAWLIARARPVHWSKPRVSLAAGGGVCAVLAIGTWVGQWDVALLISGPFQKHNQARPGGEVLYFREGIDTTVAVRQTESENLSLTVNGKPDASTFFDDVRTQLLLGHLPALLDPQARRACVIGLGCGMTLASVARHPSYERLDCVEISDAVIDAVSLFNPYNDDILHSDPRVRLIRGDGRNHLLLTEEKYDLIVSEPSNPWIAGVSNLFTREFFELCKQRMNHQGRLAIWMHSYSMSQDDFKMVIRTMNEVFGFVSLWILLEADFCVIAGNEPFHIPPEIILNRYATATVRADLYRAGIRDAAGVFGSFVAAGPRLRDWAASAPVHTDDNSILEFSAPKHFYTHEGLSLVQDLSRIQATPFDDVIAPSPSNTSANAFQSRVSSVIDSRNAIYTSLRQWQDGLQAEALRTLIDGYKRDAGNPLVFRQLSDLLGLAADAESGVPQIEGLPQLQKEIDSLPIALVVSMRNSTQPQIAQWFYNKARHYRAKQLPTALDCLTQAHALAPDDGLIAITLASARIQNNEKEAADLLLTQFLQSYPQDGWANYAAAIVALEQQKPDQALNHLDWSLRSGVIKPKQLADDPAIAPLRGNSSFKTLLQRYTSSQPSTNLSLHEEQRLYQHEAQASEVFINKPAQRARTP